MSRGIESIDTVCLSGSVRISRIESARALVPLPRLSEPSTSVTFGSESMLPPGTSAASVRLSSRLLAFSTSPANAR